ncbi:adenine phosphoribosyltransferase-like isoform X2 [Daktulosphaira vitifoliae]|uniref:adenine phosphoribosyltransferase-like isoform X2 n=1 Tax=Daktulosphaira vitifoliae TaxID=58002 RepID=UPI0021A9D84A|nr:adenine phosphoribosyltransferase-like isoform X2 [Daktulosphaira vitifoliae]
MSPINSFKDDVKELLEFVQYFPDFPKPGILYKDVLSAFNSAEGVNLISRVLQNYAESLRGKVDCVAMLESRGFLLGPIIALHLNIPCVPVCKKGNLPNPVFELSYSLEYGEDTVVIQLGSVQKGNRIVVVDDFLATGGTLQAATTLLKNAGGIVVECFVLMEKLELKGREKLDCHITCLVSE